MKKSDLIGRLNTALGKRRAGDYSEALKEFEDLEQRSVHPEDIAALRLFQATCLTDMGQPEDALKRISKVERTCLTPSDQVDCEYELARIERALGHANSALRQADKALEIARAADNKESVRIVSRNLNTLRGILLAESGRCEEAIPILQTVPAEDEGWDEAHLLLGDCQYRSGQYNKAIECYLSIISSGNNISNIIRNDAFRNTGSAYHQLRDYAKAVEYLSKVRDAYDEYPAMKAELFGFLASSYSHLGMTQEAAKYSRFSRGSISIQ